MSKPIRILGVSGSLRKASANTGLLRVAAETAPEGVTVEIFDLSAVPLYNGDVEEAEGFPAAVVAFREAVRNADALLIATPEYNYSIPGVLKNAVDWASRGADQPFSGKPTGIVGTAGWQGSSRAQYHLRQVLSALNAHTVNKPEVQIPFAWELFSPEGELKKPEEGKKVTELVAALAAWARKLQG